MKSYQKYFLISIAVIVLDQIVKLLVYNFMEMGYNGEIKILGNLFKLHYTLNPGMAMGLQLEHIVGTDFMARYGKLILSVFRLVAMVLISIYLYQMAEKKAHKGLLICIALILGGAVGNVIDTTFYGVLLNNAPYGVISPWFHGQVIDMFYIDIWEGFLPDWIPVFGSQYYSFWPIFNIADSAIFVSVIVILIFQKQFFKEEVSSSEMVKDAQ
jgi:signal peptidase II